MFTTFKRVHRCHSQFNCTMNTINIECSLLMANLLFFIWMWSWTWCIIKKNHLCYYTHKAFKSNTNSKSHLTESKPAFHINYVHWSWGSEVGDQLRTYGLRFNRRASKNLIQHWICFFLRNVTERLDWIIIWLFCFIVNTFVCVFVFACCKWSSSMECKHVKKNIEVPFNRKKKNLFELPKSRISQPKLQCSIGIPRCDMSHDKLVSRSLMLECL